MARICAAEVKTEVAVALSGTLATEAKYAPFGCHGNPKTVHVCPGRGHAYAVRYLHVYWMRSAITGENRSPPAQTLVPDADADAANRAKGKSKASLRLAVRVLCIIAALATITSFQ